MAGKSNNKDIVVKIAHLKKSFDDLYVLQNINLTLLRGENLAILGKSGSGKSVLIKCMVKLIQPDEGNISILGKDIVNLDIDELNNIRIKVGFLFQGGALYDSMTVRENLLFPVKRKMRKLSLEEENSMVEKALESVGLLDAIDKMPDELSGGMKKRIGLARTLILNPEIILYDEPTTGLDPITSKEISELINKIKNKYQTSSLIITHDIKCVELTANRILVLHGGKFIAEGTYDELKKSDNELVQEFFQ